MEKTQSLKKIASVLANILLYAFIAISIFGVIITVVSQKSDDGTATVFGMQIRYVLSPSMAKCEQTDVSGFEIKDIPEKSVVFVQTVPDDKAEAEKWYADLKVGDVLTFKYVYVRQETITHRITAIEKNENGGYTIDLEGDNKNSDNKVLTQAIDTSQKSSPNYVIGKVIGVSYPIGLLISVMRSTVGVICVVIIPSLVIMIFEIVKVVRLLGEDKRKAEKEEKERTENELAELRRRLSELEAEKSGKGSSEDSK